MAGTRVEQRSTNIRFYRSYLFTLVEMLILIWLFTNTYLVFTKIWTMLLRYWSIQTQGLQVDFAYGYAQVEEERSLRHVFLTTLLVQVPFNYTLSPETSILIQDHEEIELVPRNIPAANVNNR